MALSPENRKGVRSEMDSSLHEFKELTLALHYHVEAYAGEDGSVYFPAYYGKWVDSLAPYFKKVVVIAHTTYSREGMDHEVQSDNVSMCDLGPKPSLLQRVLHRKRYAEIISEQASEWDVVGFRCPTPLAIYLYPQVRQQKVFFLLVANLVNATRTSSITPWKRFPVLLYWMFDHHMLSRYGNQQTVFAIGPYFRKEFPAIRELNLLHSSTITESDIRPREECRTGETTILAYIGRLTASKGLDSAIRGISELKNRKVNVRLRIASIQFGSEYERLLRLAQDLEVTDQVEFVGYISHGAEMKAFLDEADAMVIPSRWDWQTRALFEGMARGLPIIASRGIKSLPLLFEHKEDIIFVDPDSPMQIADAVCEMREDEALRQRLISSSLRIASEKTLAKSAELLLTGLLQSSNQESSVDRAIN